MDYWDDMPELDLPEPRRKRTPRNTGDEDVVYYVRIRCPKCKSEKCPVYDSSHLPVRYHKCSGCGHCFKSVEKNT